MNFFKRKTRRTTLTISDQTKSSKASLSSGEGKASQLGSTGTLSKNESYDHYQTSETLEFKESLSKENSLKSRRGLKHTRFSDNTNGSNNTLSYHNYDMNGGNQDHPQTGQQRDMAAITHPGPNLVQDVPGESSAGAPLALYASVIKGDKAELKKIITANKELLNTADNFGRSPLMYCVLADRLDCAKLLINTGCNLDQVDNAGRSAIHSAAHKGSYKFLELLHNRGASLDIKDNDGQTALHLATRIRTPKCLGFLLRNLDPGMVDVPDNLKRTALHWGAAFNNTECVKLLIKYGINIAIPDGDGKTPLHWAANNHDPSAVNTMAALLEKSPGVLNWQDYEGRTALHFAVADGNSAAVDYLVNFKTSEYFGPYTCDVERSDNTFRTPLHWAAQLGHTHIVKLLLQSLAESQNTEEVTNKRVKSYSSDGNGATPLLYAASSNHHSVVQAMIVHDPNVIEQVDIESRNALMWAAGKGADDVIRLLLGIKKNLQQDSSDPTENRLLLAGFTPIDVNKNDNKGNTALHVAAWNGHGSSVELLLKHKADHNTVNQAKHTPIFGACENGHVDVVKYLLDYNASVSVVDSECKTPLHWAALGGHAEVCELLIKEGLDVDIRDILDRTPLQCAAFGGFINCMNLLLENGANVDHQDHEGRSALHWAAQSSHLDAVTLLFQYGVFPNPMEYSEERLTPLDHALQKENEDILHCLIEQGALSAEHIRNIAATKVQAHFRGYRVRKTFPAQKKLLMKMLKVRKEKKEKELEEKTAEQIRSTAAVRIQASYRGFRVRKDLRKKEGSEKQVKAEIPIEKENEEEIDIQNDDTKPDFDSGSHSPENLSFTDVDAKENIELVIDTSVLSHDEGVICDQLSASSHSSLQPVLQVQEKFDENGNCGEDVLNEDNPLNQVENEEAEISTNIAVLNAVINTDNDREANIPGVTAPDKEEKKKRRKSRKTRSKELARHVISDSDSSKDSLQNLARSRKVSSSQISLRSTSVQKENPTKVENVHVPVPPDQPKKKDVRRKRASRIKMKDTFSQEYPALDKVGDENNIQIEKVKDIAYRSSTQDIASFNEELPQNFNCAISTPSSSLSMSEYIESLMKMSSAERKLLIEHQNKRKEAFKVASNAAETIQKAWLKYLEVHNPEMYKKYKTARKRAKKLKKTKQKEHHVTKLTPNTQTAEDGSTIEKPTKEVLESQKSRNEDILQRSSVRASVTSTSMSSVSQNRSEASRSSILSNSDVQSGSRIRKSSKTRRPKTVGTGPNGHYVSVEKLEELSRIYGNGKLVRDMLASTGSTSLPSINTGRNVNARRPTTVAEKQGRIFESTLQGPVPALSPRNWSNNAVTQKQRRLAETPGSRNHTATRSSPSGLANKDIDVRYLPLQWQRLYGELQNADAVDEARKRHSSRFSYNLGDI